MTGPYRTTRSPRGVIRSGLLRRCGEWPRAIPQCMGRAALNRCTCPRWTQDQLRAAREHGLSADGPAELHWLLVFDCDWSAQAAWELSEHVTSRRPPDALRLTAREGKEE